MPSKTSRRLASVARELKDSVTTNWRVEGPYQWGTVGVIHGGGTFSTVDVYLDSNSGSVGATLALGIPFINGYNPTVGDVVLIGRMAGAARTQRVVLGPLEIAGQGLDTSGFYQGIKARFGKNTDTTQEVLLGEAGTGEGIGSKRTAGGNQFGIDFYTNGVVRGRFVSSRGGLDVSYDNSGSFAPSSSSGGGGTVPVKIAEVVTTNGQTNIVFSSIPQGFRHLLIYYSCRANDAGTSHTALELQFNGDASVHYFSEDVYFNSTAGVATSGAVNQTQIEIGIVPQGGLTGGVFNAGQINIVNYAVSGVDFKQANCIANSFAGGGSGQQELRYDGGFWNSTTNVTQVALFGNGVNFAANSVFTLYGIP